MSQKLRNPRMACFHLTNLRLRCSSLRCHGLNWQTRRIRLVPLSHVTNQPTRFRVVPIIHIHIHPFVRPSASSAAARAYHQLGDCVALVSSQAASDDQMPRLYMPRGVYSSCGVRVVCAQILCILYRFGQERRRKAVRCSVRYSSQ